MDLFREFQRVPLVAGQHVSVFVLTATQLETIYEMRGDRMEEGTASHQRIDQLLSHSPI